VDHDNNNIAGVSVPGVLSLGAITSSAKGSVEGPLATGSVSTKVAGANLLSSLVSATVIQGAVSITSDGSTANLSDNSTFADLAVAGYPAIGANPAPNTRISIAGLGKLWLHRVIQTATSIEVRMIELEVDTENSLGLPVGADVRIACASVGLAK
jgi:hypothetical protein